MKLPPGRLTILALHDDRTDPRNPAVGSQYEMNHAPYSLGNFCTQSQHIMVSTRGISRLHTLFTVEDGAWWAECMGSTFGTWIGGERVTRRKLVDGDRITVGPLGDPESATDSSNGIVLEFRAS
jgi:pSer/pThr/pTyr-binding forkhead associated (FHA) protein